MNVVEDGTIETMIEGIADLSAYVATAHYEPDLHWNYVVRDMLLRGEVSLLFAPSNAGKSAWAGLLSSCVAAGYPFFGRPTTRGIVVYVAAEAPKVVADRSVAYRDICVPGEAAAYVVRRGAVDLGDPEAVARFTQELRLLARCYGEDVVLVIIDTLVLSIGGLDENSTSNMTTVTEATKHIATAFDTHVCLIHHSGKDSDRGARGASAIKAAVDTEIELRPSSDGVTVLGRITKQRNLPKGSDIAFRIEAFELGEDEDGRPRTTAKAVPTQAPAISEKGAQGRTSAFDRRAAILTVLHGFRLSGRADFTTTEVMAALPPEALTGVNSDDNRKKAVARVLAGLAEGTSPPVRAAARGWVWA